MRNFRFGAGLRSAIVALAASVLPAYAQDSPRASPLDSVDLRTINAVITVFRESRASMWPGYDLSVQPFLVYRPGRWAVVLNPPGEIDGYRPYPESWPRLGAPALLQYGPNPALVGQLEFDFPVGRATMVAVPLADNLPAQALARPRSLFAFVVHEAFHQFQRTAFGEVNEPSEEQYPILDTANSARAALEIHILEDAMRAVERRDLAGSRRLTDVFLAQRRFRWENTSPLVREFERAKEISEGTATYVEAQLVANLAIMCRSGRFTDPYVCPSFGSVTVPGYLQTDFESRLTDRALSPTDVPRNRIYPTAAAMGVLLDFFSVEWKRKAANLPDSSTLADLLSPSSPVPASRLDSLRKEAERRYDLPQIQRRTRTLVDAYVREAEAAIRGFEAQPGYRVEVQLPAAGTSRSRSSSAKRWVVDNGKRVFSSEFLAYTLRRPNQQVFLTVERRAVLDDLVPQGERRVAFFVPSLDSVRVNGAPVAVTSAGDYPFDNLSIRGAGLSLDVKVPGTLRVSAGRVAVRLSQATPKDSGVEVDRASARIQIQVDSSEADAVLAIVAKQAPGQTVAAADWQRLFATQPYLRLKKREASLRRDFTDAQFQQFVLSKELGQHAPDLARTLQEWKKADLTAAARRVLPYLPGDARIHVKVYPVIKPQTNSFVFEMGTDPAIFLFLDPALTRPQFENTVAHEMHHIGYASISDRMERSLAGLAPSVKTAVEWMGAFGEGFAMLAAAGSPDVHPHAFSKSEDRARWDHDMANFSQDVKTVEKFFLDIIAGKLKTDEEIATKGMSFFGVQGAWYTVGYRMAVLIEKRDGRTALVECMSDPRKLLAAYNRAAAELNAKGTEQLALWSPELLEKIGAHADPSPDVQRYDLVIRPDFATRRLRLTATVDIANQSRETEFTFLLADWYDTLAVRSRTGRAAVERGGGAVTVRVPRASAQEQLVFTLSGTPGKSAGDDRAVIADSSIYLLWSDRFYPVDFDDWAVVSTQLEVPRGFRVFAPGRRMRAADSGALHTERFETSEPIRAASVIADARWVETERTVGGRRMRTLLYPASQAYAEQVLKTSADVLDFYASRFGRYAFDQFTFATVDGIFARRAVAGGVIYESRYLADELGTTGHDAHETALLWWFYTIAGRGPGSYQWTEGFGDYAEMLYDEARGLPVPADFESYRRGYLRMAGTPGEPPITAARGPLAGNFVHGRLPWVMHVLRFAVGDSAFDRGARLLFDRWRFRSFTLDEFVATLAEGTGQPLDWWKREWLDRGGVPEITWHAAITPDSGGYRVTVSLRQTGALYHLPVEIGIESVQGSRVERVQLDEATQEFRFWSASEPARVLIDPRRWLLAKITAN